MHGRNDKSWTGLVFIRLAVEFPGISKWLNFPFSLTPCVCPLFPYKLAQSSTSVWPRRNSFGGRQRWECLQKWIEREASGKAKRKEFIIWEPTRMTCPNVRKQFSDVPIHSCWSATQNKTGLGWWPSFQCLLLLPLEKFSVFFSSFVTCASLLCLVQVLVLQKRLGCD